MANLVHLTPLDRDYPSRLRGHDFTPASLTVRGGSTEAAVTVAVVGARRARPVAARFARCLAKRLADAGAVVVSGGAVGIDAAAHEGALDAGGRTWSVAPTGPEGCFPPQHGPLFAEIGRGPGAMIWPFAHQRPRASSFLARNRVLIALADAVVVVQAGLRSGALHAASWARSLRKPLWVVPPAPWMKGFGGSRLLLRHGALPLTSSHLLLQSLGLVERNRPADPASAGAALARLKGELLRSLSSHEIAVLDATSSRPSHADAISARAGTSPQATTAALLTLALENVLVEGPPGFFRRRDARNR
jgi:DNA processing protein